MLDFLVVDGVGRLVVVVVDVAAGGGVVELVVRPPELMELSLVWNRLFLLPKRLLDRADESELESEVEIGV